MHEVTLIMNILNYLRYCEKADDQLESLYVHAERTSRVRPLASCSALHCAPDRDRLGQVIPVIKGGSLMSESDAVQAEGKVGQKHVLR